MIIILRLSSWLWSQSH